MESETTAERDVPLRITSRDRMRRLASRLEAAGYTAGGVCERLGMDSIYAYEEREGEDVVPSSLDSTLDVLIHLYLAGRPVPRDTVDSLMPSGLAELLEEHGLLRMDATDSSRVAPTVMFYPAEGLLLVSDLARRPVLPDAVYPAIAANTGELIELLPHEFSGTFLDLCSGTAIGALVAASRADRRTGDGDPSTHAWAVDVTTRATRFAEFNAALNGISNLTVLQGDLWDPVAGMVFDRIVAHPPYVPTVQSDLIYRAGGEDGEQITRRILGGLDEHLGPEGRFWCSCMLSDREDAPLERRIREMLGDAERNFDVYVLARGVSTPRGYFRRHVTNSDAPSADDDLVERLRKLGVVRLVLCTLVIDRHGQNRAGITTRRQAGDGTGRAEVDWLIEWERAAADPDLPARLIESRPRLSPAVRLEVVSRPGQEGWVTQHCRLRTDWPFPRVVEIPPEIARFLTRCNGRTDLHDLRVLAGEAGLVPSDMTDEGFAASLLPLMGSGILIFSD